MVNISEFHGCYFYAALDGSCGIRTASIYIARRIHTEIESKLNHQDRGEGLANFLRVNNKDNISRMSPHIRDGAPNFSKSQEGGQALIYSVVCSH